MISKGNYDKPMNVLKSRRSKGAGRHWRNYWNHAIVFSTLPWSKETIIEYARIYDEPERKGISGTNYFNIPPSNISPIPASLRIGLSVRALSSKTTATL